MKLTFLSAAVPLTKTFTLNNGVLEKQAHPKITSCTSHEEHVSTIEEFKNALVAHAAQNHCLLKGNIKRALVKESRAGSTDPNEKTGYVVLDIDRLKGCGSVAELLKLLDLHEIDYIVQYSSSMGVVPDSGLSAHVFMLLDADAIPEFLKRWLIRENLLQPLLTENLNLTRTGNALRWGLDVTTCQNDKLIYIAPPILGKGVVDRLTGDRIQLIKRSKRTLSLPKDVPNSEGIRDLVQKGLKLIRARDGLAEKPESRVQQTGTIEWMPNPDKAQVTGVKEDGPFVHLNINGGDSWAYWHHKSNPDFIHNFKGEPSYRTSELLPDYWETVRPAGSDNSPAHTDTDDTEYFVYCDERTATYHKAIWTPSTANLEIYPAKSEKHLRDFLKEHGRPAMEFVPNWKVSFNPNSNIRVDHTAKRINEFQPTKYMALKGSTGARVPPIIHKIIWHCFGSDQETYERVLNWLAVIWQFRCKAETAWLTYGTTGTGKGTFTNKVLAPLFGHVEFRKSRDILSIYNEFLEKSLILVIDEAELGGKNGGSIVESDIKNFITERLVSIRRMHMAPYSVHTYVSTIFCSNVYVPVRLDYNDRRFNVAPFQKEAIKFLMGEYDAIIDELEELAQFLWAYPADRELARQPLMNEARKNLIWMGQSGTDSVVDYLRKGDYGFFVAGKPAIFSQADSEPERELATAYGELVTKMRTRTYLLREELQVLISYLMDNIPKSSYKFESFMKHRGIIFEGVEHNGKTYKGIRVKWNEQTSQTAEPPEEGSVVESVKKPRVRNMGNKGRAAA